MSRFHNKRYSNLTASLFWDYARDVLKIKPNSKVKASVMLEQIKQLFDEWKKVEKSYQRKISDLENANDLLQNQIDDLNNQLTHRNILMTENATLAKKLRDYQDNKESSKVLPFRQISR